MPQLNECLSELRERLNGTSRFESMGIDREIIHDSTEENRGNYERVLGCLVAGCTVTCTMKVAIGEFDFSPLHGKCLLLPDEAA